MQLGDRCWPETVAIQNASPIDTNWLANVFAIKIFIE